MGKLTIMIQTSAMLPSSPATVLFQLVDIPVPRKTNLITCVRSDGYKPAKGGNDACDTINPHGALLNAHDAKANARLMQSMKGGSAVPAGRDSGQK
jgi:hypothetical protein